MSEVYELVGLGFQPTLEEFNNLPEDLIDRILLFKAIVNTIQYGGEMNL